MGIFPLAAFSQSIVSGTISDSANKGIAGATITYSGMNSPVIAGFTRTNDIGYFALRIFFKADSIAIHIRHVSYKEQSVVVKNETANYSFVLTPGVLVLRNVVVTSPPIYKSKDTINYNVDAFSSKRDFVIGDIIKKLPGIEMVGDKILYQGKPIQAYFINGLDLLEGRYGLANNNLPADAVQKVQIIENDQTVKILDSLVFSNRASINIKLKKVLTTGTGKIGLGASPLLWDVNLTPMTFNRTFQALNSLQVNNVGNDVAKQLTRLTVDNIFDMPEPLELEAKSTASFTDIEQIFTPAFDEKRWLNNHVGMFSSDVLKKFDNNIELKENISYVNDHKLYTGTTYTSIYTPAQPINVTERISNGYNTNDLRGNFILLKNEKRIYFKNSLSVIKKWNGDAGDIWRNDSPIQQRKELQDLNLSNQFTSAFFLAKQLVTVHSFLSFINTPQHLLVNPGQYIDVLNDSIPYGYTRQNIGYTKLATDNYVNFVKGGHAFTLLSRMGIFYQAQHLRSVLNISDSGRVTALGNDFENDLCFRNMNVFVDEKWQYKSGHWQIELITPLRQKNFLVRDNSKNIDNHISSLNFEPNGFVLYSINSYWEGKAASDYSKQYGGVTSLYSGYLLTLYSNLQKFNATVPQSNVWNNNITFHYKDILNSTFANISYSVDQQKRNYLYNNILDANGFNTIEMINTNAGQLSQSLSTDYSKYFPSLKTILKAAATVSVSKADYVLNDTPAVLKTEGYTGSINVTNSSFRFFSFSYNTHLSIVKSKLAGTKMENIFLNDQLLEINVSALKNSLFSLKPDYYITNVKGGRSQLFLDFQYRFSLVKSKLDFEISGLNLLNNKNYVSIYNSDFSVVENRFTLRPRQLRAAVSFRF
jgi:hypothetical protein